MREESRTTNYVLVACIFVSIVLATARKILLNIDGLLSQYRMLQVIRKSVYRNCFAAFRSLLARYYRSY